VRLVHGIGDSRPIAIDWCRFAILRSIDIGGDHLSEFLAQGIEFLRLTLKIEDPIVIGGMDLLQTVYAGEVVRCNRLRRLGTRPQDA